MLRWSSALFNVANCRPLYRRYSFVTWCSSIAGVTSHRLRERIAQPVEHPIAGEKQHDRRDSEGEQPLPMSQRSVEEEDLLIGDREVRKGIDVEQPAELLHVRLEPRIDDRRREEPEHQHIGEDVTDVAEMDREGGEDQGQRRREDQLDEDR